MAELPPNKRNPTPEFPTPSPQVVLISEIVDRSTPAYINNHPVRGTPYSTSKGAKKDIIDAYPDGLYFLRETRAGNSDQLVIWYWSTDRNADSTYNSTVEYIAESTDCPAYTRVYIIRREVWETTQYKATAGPLTALIGIRVTAGGHSYTKATIKITGTGTGATAQAVFGDNGEILAVIVNNEGTGYTAVPTIQITGDGEGATAVGQIQPQTAVLTNQKKEELPPNDERALEYVQVTRVYKTQPGPELVTQSIGQPNLTPEKYRRQVNTIVTEQDVNADYDFPDGLEGDQVQIELQQKTVVEARLKIIEEVIATGGTSLQGQDWDEYGPLAISEEVVTEGTAIDESYLTKKSSVTPFGNGKAVKITISYPDNLADIRKIDQIYDQRLDVHFTQTRYLTEKGALIGTAKRDIKNIDEWHDEVTEHGGNIAVLDTFIYSMAGTTNIDMPDRLVGVQTFAETGSGGGHSNATATATTSGGSVYASAQASGQASGAASVEVAPKIRQFYGNEIPCMFHHVYLLSGSTYTDVRSRLTSLIGTTVNQKPNFNPEVVQLVTKSSRFSSRSNSSRSKGASVSRNSDGDITGTGESEGTGGGSGSEAAITVRKTTISPTIHETLAISEQISIVVPGVGIDPGEGGTATGQYLSGSIPATTGDTTWPITGLYLWSLRPTVFKQGYVLFQALVIDASLLPNVAEGSTSDYYYYLDTITALTGGTATDLDGFAIDDYPVNVIFEVAIDGRGSSQWKKKAWDADALFGGATPVSNTDGVPGGIIKPLDWHAVDMNYVLERQRGY